MTKEIRNIVITAVIALFVGYMIGGITQTGLCPITGTVIWKNRVAACADKKEHCEQKDNSACKQECKKDAPAVDPAQ